MQVNIVFAIVSIVVVASIHRTIADNITDEMDNHYIKRSIISDSDNEDNYLDSGQLIAKYGHPVEEYYVTTEDGYILKLFRIPGSGPVMFIFHGLLSSSDDVLTNGPHTALPYVLANSSYDIWLGNARGNKYSNRHVRLSTAQRQFWEFSWHEIGIYDLPAMIDFALATSNQSQLVYIGHSQGTTSFFVLCSLRPEYNQKIALAFSLSTVAYNWRTFSPAIRLLAPFQRIEYLVAYNTGFFQLVPPELSAFLTLVCDSSIEAELACATIVFSVLGFDYQQLEKSELSVQLAHFPSDSAVKQLIHYFQSLNSKRFAQFDYGLRGNMRRYGTFISPRYPVENITAPISIFYGLNDYLSNFEDVKVLIAQLPNVVDVYQVPYSKFNHFDYLWAKDALTLVYQRILAMINNLYQR